MAWNGLIAHSALIYPLLNQKLNPETQIQLPTLKAGYIVRIITNEGKSWDRKELVVAENHPPCSYNIPSKRGNLMFRNYRYLIPWNEKFNIKHDYENIIEPTETPSRKTVMS